MKSKHDLKMIVGHLNILPLRVAKVVSRQKIKPVPLFLSFKATWSLHLCNSDSCKTVLKCQVLIIAKLSVFAITNHFTSMGPLGKALFLLGLWKVMKNRVSRCGHLCLVYSKATMAALRRQEEKMMSVCLVSPCVTQSYAQDPRLTYWQYFWSNLVI